MKKTSQKKKKGLCITHYEGIFFGNPDSSASNGKSVYISPEFHERISRIVQVIGDDKITIYAYLNNVLAYHFQDFVDFQILNFIFFLKFVYIIHYGIC